MTSCNVLISSAGRRVGLMDCIRRDMAALDITGELIAADMSELCAARAFASRFVQVPAVSNPGFADELLDLCQKLEVALVVPTIDPELPVYASLRDEFAATGTTVLISGPETVRITGDKRETWRWLREAGLPTVLQWDLQDALTSVDELRYPLIAKPARGSASVGVQLLRDASELHALSGSLEMVIQELARGHEYTVDVWVGANGEPTCAVPRRRLEVRSGEVSKGLTDARPVVVDVASDVAASLPDAFGPLTVQVFATDENDVRVIEINPRFGGGYPLAWEAGARYTRWALQHAMGAAPEPNGFEWQDELVMLRYDEAVFFPQSQEGVWR